MDLILIFFMSIITHALARRYPFIYLIPATTTKTLRVFI